MACIWYLVVTKYTRFPVAINPKGKSLSLWIERERGAHRTWRCGALIHWFFGVLGIQAISLFLSFSLYNFSHWLVWGRIYIEESCTYRRQHEWRSKLWEGGHRVGPRQQLAVNSGFFTTHLPFSMHEPIEYSVKVCI